MEPLLYITPCFRALGQSVQVSHSSNTMAKRTKAGVSAARSRCRSHLSSVVRNSSGTTAMDAEPTLERPPRSVGQGL